MVQKITWIAFLIFGINIILVPISGCGKKTVEKPFHAKYRYVNDSNHDMVIDTWQNLNDSLYKFKYALARKLVFEQDIELTSGSVSGLIIYSDSLQIIFDAKVQKTFRKAPKDASAYNLLLIENYKLTKIDNGEEYSYSITDDDYKNAQ